MTSATELKWSQYLDRLVNYNMTYDDLLKRADPNDHIGFVTSVALVFDVCPRLIAHLCNLDYLCSPSINGTTGVNYIQWITIRYKGLGSVFETLAFLFANKDDKLEPDELEKEKIRLKHEHLEKILTKHGSAENYFRYVANRLWKDEEVFIQTYDYFLNVTEERLGNIKIT